ncbi:MAG TPA: hypothetical protein DD417_10030 [Elusimicrobia bacterium]|nr:hypothetical protein [Elusimicrobiota bacterium]
MRTLIVSIVLAYSPVSAQAAPGASFADLLGGARTQILASQSEMGQARRQNLASSLGQVALDLVNSMTEAQRLRCGIAELRVQTRQGHGLGFRLAILHRTHELKALSGRLHNRMELVTRFARAWDGTSPLLASAAEGLFVAARHLLGQATPLSEEVLGLAADLESFGFRNEANEFADQASALERDSRELDLQSQRIRERAGTPV